MPPINVMPNPREGGDTWEINLISLLLGRDFILFDIKEAPQGLAF
jgi:hypothetical protein